MRKIDKLESDIEEIIDDLKGLCQTKGLSNQAGEEEIITSVFLYKFLNDKFMQNIKEFSEKVNMSVEEVLIENKDEIMDAFYNVYPRDVSFEYKDTIEYLVNKASNDNFHIYFDDALENISNNPLNESFAIENAEGSKEPLFKRIIDEYVTDGKANFARNIIGIISQKKFDFSEAFNENFDFYGRIFEYLIKDFNVASDVYAEYFTPQSISKIIAKILVNMSPVEDKSYDIYDPSAGSGSLILHLANELGKGSFGNKAQVYTQDISVKSTRFLRINMMLNGLTDSMDNIVNGDTLVSPAHYNEENDPSSGIKLFDYITGNPPFKTDFSSTRNEIEEKWIESEERDGLPRFFAGIPKIPPKNKKGMEIYLCFIQHVLWSLKKDGKAAIVVPSGFLTAKSGIPKKVRKEIIDKKWVKGAISMPSNIFANTGTKVSVLFIDKSNQDEDVILIDASNFGEKTKVNGLQKTILRQEEINKIEDTFIKREVIENFSALATYDQITKKDYSLSAGQHFEIKIEYETLSEEEFILKMETYKNNLKELFDESEKLNNKILDILDKLKR